MATKRMKKEDRESLCNLIEKAALRLNLYQYGDLFGWHKIHQLQKNLLWHTEQLTRTSVVPSKKIYEEISFLLQATADIYSHPAVKEVGIIPSAKALREAVTKLKPYR